MKKQALILILHGLLSLFIFQNGFAQSISVGVRAGVLLNNVSVDPKDSDIDPKMLFAPQIAVPIEIAFGDMFAIQPEIMYGSQGYKVEESETTTEGTVTIRSKIDGQLKANTLEIPLLAKVKFGTELLKFHVLAGPSIGFGLGGEAEATGTIVATENTTGEVVFEEEFSEKGDLKFVGNDYDPDDVNDGQFAFAKTNINAHFGAGVNLMLGSATLFFDARYILGLSDLSPKAEGESDDGHTTTKGKRIGLSVGVLFPLVGN